ncbi:MAG: hypothetical protein AAGA03_12770 [Planctomycetota bacterium]
MGDQHVDGEKALVAARQRLDLTSTVTVLAAGNDIDDARALGRLSATTNVRIRYAEDPSLTAVRQSVLRDGTVSATLASVSAHADFVWLIGDADACWPRLRSRWLEPMTHERGVVILDDSLGLSVTELGTRLRRLPNDTKYIAVCVFPGAFEPGEETAAAVLLNRCVIQKNETTRAVLVVVDDLATDRAVHAWQTNELLPVTSPECPAMIQLGDVQREASCMVQIGGFDRGPSRSDVFLPAGTAGIHRRGTVIRGDGTVTLALSAPRPSSLPSAVDTLRRLLQTSP